MNLKNLKTVTIQSKNNYKLEEINDLFNKKLIIEKIDDRKYILDNKFIRENSNSEEIIKKLGFIPFYAKIFDDDFLIVELKILNDTGESKTDDLPF